jgi:hypothetical protein
MRIEHLTSMRLPEAVAVPRSAASGFGQVYAISSRDGLDGNAERWITPCVGLTAPLRGKLVKSGLHSARAASGLRRVFTAPRQRLIGSPTSGAVIHTLGIESRRGADPVRPSNSRHDNRLPFSPARPSAAQPRPLRRPASAIVLPGPGHHRQTKKARG